MEDVHNILSLKKRLQNNLFDIYANVCICMHMRQAGPGFPLNVKVSVKRHKK